MGSWKSGLHARYSRKWLFLCLRDQNSGLKQQENQIERTKIFIKGNKKHWQENNFREPKQIKKGVKQDKSRKMGKQNILEEQRPTY